MCPGDCQIEDNEEMKEQCGSVHQSSCRLPQDEVQRPCHREVTQIGDNRKPEDYPPGRGLAGEIVKPSIAGSRGCAHPGKQQDYGHVPDSHAERRDATRMPPLLFRSKSLIGRSYPEHAALLYTTDPGILPPLADERSFDVVPISLTEYASPGRTEQCPGDHNEKREMDGYLG